MLLSFSVPAMLPMIERGLRQRAGEGLIGGVAETRVKRQTIRKMGPRAVDMLERAAENEWNCPYDLHLWWKSRTKQRAHLGTVQGAKVYPIEIEHKLLSTVRMILPRALAGDGVLYGANILTFWSETRQEGRSTFEEFAYADGFDSGRDFVRFFVPNKGDRFEGVVFKW
jgi:hypothetical protein